MNHELIFCLLLHQESLLSVVDWKKFRYFFFLCVCVCGWGHSYLCRGVYHFMLTQNLSLGGNSNERSRQEKYSKHSPSFDITLI